MSRGNVRRGRIRAAAVAARTAAWHLRHGGVPAVRHYWHRRRARTIQSLHRAAVRDGGQLSYQAWPIPDAPLRRKGLRVAVILDDFSRLALGFEWQQVEITPATWRRMLETDLVDLLFVESAWHGNQDAWQFRLTGSRAPDPALRELVTWCRDRTIPTVFWNKEDPTHYEDFLATAALFDHVFTTDEGRVADYRRDLGHDRVAVLPFAAQPAIHNPIRYGPEHQQRDVAFAGMYFAHRHSSRREQMSLLLGAAMRAGEKMEYGLEIYSRQFGNDVRYQFPAPYSAHVVGSLDYGQMLTAYRAHKVFLNVNTVVGSSTMCARRIFEIAACGTAVVSTTSPAIDAVFPQDEVPQVSEPREAEAMIRALVRNAEIRDRMVHRAQRRIWAGQTYAHRVDSVLRTAGLDAFFATTVRPTVTALVSTNRPAQVDHVLGTVGAQEDVRVQLALLAHGFDLDRDAVLRRAQEAGIEDVVLLRAGSDIPLGGCLNMLVTAADGDVVAKIDDDDIYTPSYLSDQLDTLEYSRADVVGKQAHYMYFAETGATILRFGGREHCFTDFVMGPTLVARRTTARENPFPDVSRGEDTGFLRSVVGSGLSVYSGDRFNFAQVRDPARATHTWSVTDAELLATGDVQSYGDPFSHVQT